MHFHQDDEDEILDDNEHLPNEDPLDIEEIMISNKSFDIIQQLNRPGKRENKKLKGAHHLLVSGLDLNEDEDQFERHHN